MLHYISFLEIHALIDHLHLIVDFVELVHEVIRFTLLILLLAPLHQNPVLEPLHLLLEVFSLDLLLE